MHRLEIVQQVVDRRERDVRAIPHFARPFGARRAVDDVGRLQLAAGDLLDRLLETRLVVGHVDGDRRRTARDDAEHVAVVHQLLRDPLEQIAHAAGVVELQVQVVDEEQEDAARDVGLADAIGGRMIPSGGGGGGGARTLVTRPPVTTVIDVMSCFTPSS